MSDLRYITRSGFKPPIDLEVNNVGLRDRSVAFYSDDLENYTLLRTGEPDSDTIVNMPNGGPGVNTLLLSGGGGVVNQLTSNNTGVTLNTNSGRINMFGDLAVGPTTAEFILTNDKIASTSSLLATASTIGNSGNLADLSLSTDNIGEGTCHIKVINVGTVAPIPRLCITFIVI